MKVDSKFIGKFKLGDNIVHNLNILSLLYAFHEKEGEENRQLLRKPMILTIGSCCEALLHDLFFKINNLTNEGVGDLPEDVLEKIRKKKISRFHYLIDHAKSNDLFNQKHTDLYDALFELKKHRDRIHIHVMPEGHPRDESESYSIDNLISAEKVFEGILKIMSHKHSRKFKKSYVPDFEYPWECHFQVNDLVQNNLD